MQLTRTSLERPVMWRLVKHPAILNRTAGAISYKPGLSWLRTCRPPLPADSRAIHVMLVSTC